MGGNDDDLRLPREGRHGNAFAVLGPHEGPGGRTWVRNLVTGAAAVAASTAAGRAELFRRGDDGLFEGPLPQPGAYRIDVTASVVEWTD